MTEADWLNAARPAPILAYLRGRASDRKFHLFACACCRHLWPLLNVPRSRQAVEVLEQYADGRADGRALAEACRMARAAGVAAQRTRFAADEALRRVRQTARRPWGEVWEGDRKVQEHLEREGAAWLVWRLTAREWKAPEAAAAAAAFALDVAAEHGTEAEEGAVLTALVREIFGNPFWSVTLESPWFAWRDGTVPRMARCIDEGQTFADLPILADALEEAGCTNPTILAHCRQPAEHARGCWLVDHLLDKA